MNTTGRIELVVLDCDSTLTTLEGVDELARRRGVGEAISILTNAAMNGEVPLEEVYGRRLDIIKPSAEDLVWLGERYQETLVSGARELVDTLQGEGREVRIVSGGLLQPVVLLARFLGLPSGHVHAVPVRLDYEGRYEGYDEVPPARAGGKADLVEHLASGRRTVVVGDGVTDLETRSAGARVVGFGGVAARRVVQEGADAWVAGPSLLSVLEVIRKWDDA